MLPDQNTKPVFTMTLGEVNEAFSRLNRSYEDTYLKYAQPKAESDWSWAEMNLKELLARKRLPEDQYIHPEFMRSFLGEGIVHSYGRATEKRVTPDHARVGLALSKFHGAMRNITKDLSYEFLSDDLSVEHLSEEAIRDLQEQQWDPEAFVLSFRSVLQWLGEQDHPNATAPMPDEFQNTTSEQIVQDIERRFACLKKFPIKFQDTKIDIENAALQVTEMFLDDADYGTSQRTVPIAAVYWAVKHAGMFILNRPPKSIARKFLVRIFGIDKEAGRKIVEIADHLTRQSSGKVWDYNRKTIHDALYDQRFWLKTAAMSELIMGRKKNYEGFANALEMIRESPISYNFYSAHKAAVLLYATLQRYKRHEPELPDHAPRVDEKDQIQISNLCEELTKIGYKTEASLLAAKKHRHLGLQKAPDEGAAEGIKGNYREEKSKAYGVQQRAVNKLFAKNPEFQGALTRLNVAVALMNNYVRIDDSAEKVMIQTLAFCQGHLAVPPVHEAGDTLEGSNDYRI